MAGGDSRNKTPLISVIVPVYNVENYILNSLKSLDRQTFRDFEIILVDDGSPDGSIRIASDYLAGTNLACTIVKQENKGQGIARNSGVEAAHGEWIYFLDSDDAIQPFTFEGFNVLIRDGHAPDIIFTRFQMVSVADIFKSATYQTNTLSYSRDELLDLFLLRRLVPLVPGTFYAKKMLVKNEIFHEGIRWSEDQHFMWRVLANINVATFWNCITYNYCQHEGSIMTSTPSSRIVAAYKCFLRLPAEVGCGEVSELLVPRWVLGSLHATAPLMGYETWHRLYEDLDGAYNIRKLTGFPDLKIRLLGYVGAISPKLLYFALSGGHYEAE